MNNTALKASRCPFEMKPMPSLSFTNSLTCCSAIKGYAKITKAETRADEVQSDRFAFEVLARSATPPTGAVFYFQAQVYRFRHRGEFPTAKAWDDYLMTVATHPMTVDRIKAMSRYISGQLAAKRGPKRISGKASAHYFPRSPVFWKIMTLAPVLQRSPPRPPGTSSSRAPAIRAGLWNNSAVADSPRRQCEIPRSLCSSPGGSLCD
jgi:hypothetical protein